MMRRLRHALRPLWLRRYERESIARYRAMARMDEPLEDRVRRARERAHRRECEAAERVREAWLKVLP